MNNIRFRVSKLRIVVVSLVVCMGGLSSYADDEATFMNLRMIGLRSDQGVVRVELFDSEARFSERKPVAVFSCGITNKEAQARIPFPESPAFAVRVFHDENDNGEIDRTPLGIPEEAIGFSNNARARFGPPSFREAAVSREGAPSAMEIRMERPLATDWQVGVGVGAVFRESPYVGGGYQSWVFPNVAYVGRRFAILGPRVSYLVTGGDRWKWNAVGQVRFNALDPEASDELEGMKERDLTWEIGFKLGLRGPHKLDFGVGALTDVLGRHDGQEFVADVSRSFSYGALRIAPAFSLTILSTRLANYYYGVSPSEERLPERPAYDSPAAWIVAPSVRVSWLRWDPWTVTASLGVEYLGPHIADSPIVEKRAPLTGFLAISRQFGPGARDR